MISSIIFDLDGTLIDSSEEIIFCLGQAYEHFGIKLEMPIKLNIIGPPLADMIGVLSPGLDIVRKNQLITEFREIYNNSGFHKTHPYVGCRDLLSRLKELDYKLFIATNKPRISTESILVSTKLRNYFTDISCVGDKDINSKTELISRLIKKWKINESEALFVGDTVGDVLAGKANKLKNVALMTGYGDEIEIEKSCPDFKIFKLDDLLSILKIT